MKGSWDNWQNQVELHNTGQGTFVGHVEISPNT